MEFMAKKAVILVVEDEARAYPSIAKN